MGADIHFYVEKKKRDGKWHLAECHEIEPDTYEEKGDSIYIRSQDGGRNYGFFGLLANVRGYSGESTIPARGVPKDVSPDLGRYIEQWGCDAHSTSHCSISEYEAVCDEFAELCKKEGNSDYSGPWREVIQYALDWLSKEAVETALLDDPYKPDIRFVYFFDN